MKKNKIIFWISTGIIFLFDCVPGIFFNAPLAVEGIRALGFPHYFGIELGIAKFIGGFALILPMVPARVKEWAYAGFGITMISALIAEWVVYGPIMAILPLVGFAFLSASYISYHKIKGV